MQEFLVQCLAVISSSLIAWMGVRYCMKIVHDGVGTITTWIIFEVGSTISLVTYFTGKQHSIVSSITNVADGVFIALILGTLYAKHRGETIVFSKNEKRCLRIAAGALVVWAITRTSWVGVAGFQVVMIVAYFPTFERIQRWERAGAPEPVETWSVNALVAIMGVVIAIARNDYVAMLYPMRAVVLCAVVVTLIVRCKRRNSHRNNPQAR